MGTAAALALPFYQHKELTSCEAYFNDDLNLMSTTTILLVWFGKNSSSEIRLEALKQKAKRMGLKLLHNKEKNTYIKAVASTLLQEKKVSVPSEVLLYRLTQEDVSVCNP